MAMELVVAEVAATRQALAGLRAAITRFQGKGAPISAPAVDPLAEMAGRSGHMTTLCDLYASHLNISHWRVSFLARRDGQFFKRIADGKGCTLKTADTVLRWFSDNWPADLEWPRHIPRPPKQKKEAA